MATTTVNINPDKQELRKFGLIFAGMFILIFGLLLPWIWDKPSPRWPWIVAAVFIAAALAVPMMLGPVYRLWMKIGHVLGWINTRIILGLVFFFIFVVALALLHWPRLNYEELSQLECKNEQKKHGGQVLQ